MDLYSSGAAALKDKNQDQLALFDSRKRKYRDIELEVNQNRFQCAALGENLLNYSADLREAFEKKSTTSSGIYLKRYNDGNLLSIVPIGQKTSEHDLP